MEQRVVRSKQKLTIAFNGVPVGLLSKFKSGGLQFQYNESWLNQMGARAVSLSLPLRTQPYQGDRVYNFFDNLLPDNPAIRTRIQARFKVDTNEPFDLLSAIGMDCVGAIQLFPESIEMPDVKCVHATPVSEAEVAKILKGYRMAPLGMAQTIDDFRISIAGAQEKTALLWHDNQWLRPHRCTATNRILKLPIGIIEHSQLDLSQSCENEWLCLQILKAFGLPVPEAQVVHFEEMKVLSVERFDRRWSSNGKWLMRLPQEDMCQALGVAPALKYESDGGPGIETIMKLLLGSEKAIEDRDTFIKSQIIFWLIAAIDGHAKNFSVFILPGSGFRLTPLYDVISALPHLNSQSLSKQKIKMAMAVEGRNRHYHWAKIQARHFISTAEKCGYPVESVLQIMSSIFDTIDTVVHAVSNNIPNDFPDNIVTPILDGMVQLAHKLRDTVHSI